MSAVQAQNIFILMACFVFFKPFSSYMYVTYFIFLSAWS